MAEPRIYMIVSEEFYGKGLRGVFTSLEAAKAYGAANNPDNVDFIILSYAIDRPETERVENDGTDIDN